MTLESCMRSKQPYFDLEEDGNSENARETSIWDIGRRKRKNHIAFSAMKGNFKTETTPCRTPIQQRRDNRAP